MALPGSLQLSHGLGLCRNLDCNKHSRATGCGKLHLFSAGPSYPILFVRQECRGFHHLRHINRPTHTLSCKSRSFKCHCFLVSGQPNDIPAVKVAATVLARSCNVLQNSPIIVKLIPAVGVIIFAIWGVGPLLFQTRKLLFQRSDSSWKKSTTYYIVTSYLQPLLLWTGAILICRSLEPLILPSETSQIIKERLLNFVRSLSTVLAFAYCLSSVIQQAQKFLAESTDASEARNILFSITGRGAGTVPNRPLLVIEPSYKINGDDKKSRSARPAVDQDNKTATQTKVDTKTDNVARGTQDDTEGDNKVVTPNSDANGNSRTVVTPKPDPEVGENKPLKSDSNKENVEVPESPSKSKVTGLVGDNSAQKDVDVKQSKVQITKNIKPNIDSDNVVSSSTNNADKIGGLNTNMPMKQQGEKKPAAQAHASRTVLEENIVLGVALEGSKRTLPIDEEMDNVTCREANEMAALQGGNGSPNAPDGNDK